MADKQYIRNIGAISEEEQVRLRASRVLIVGCGGLGGSIFSNLVRIGLGHITVVDCDVFDETNLNRQQLCTRPSLGRPKVEVAAEFAADIDTGIEIIPVYSRFDGTNCDELLKEQQVVIDALDNVESRRILAHACEKAGVPLVYGAISGFAAQVSVLMPDRVTELMKRLYPTDTVSGGKSCLAFTPAVCAGIQSAQAVKLLLGKPTELENRLLYIDLLFDECQYIEL